MNIPILEFQYRPTLYYQTKKEMYYAQDTMFAENEKWIMKGARLNSRIIRSTKFYEDKL